MDEVTLEKISQILYEATKQGLLVEVCVYAVKLAKQYPDQSEVAIYEAALADWVK